MILTGPEIERQVEGGRITIDPFDPEQLSPNSYDLRLGETLLRYTDPILDPACELQVEELTFGEEGHILRAGEFVLGCSHEVIGSDSYVPVIKGRSSAARLGLFVHVTADIFDLGAFAQSTLQLYAAHNVRLVPGSLIAQVTFWRPEGEIQLYQGKYQHSRGPRASLMHRDPFFGGRQA